MVQPSTLPNSDYNIWLRLDVLKSMNLNYSVKFQWKNYWYFFFYHKSYRSFQNRLISKPFTLWFYRNRVIRAVKTKFHQNSLVVLLVESRILSCHSYFVNRVYWLLTLWLFLLQDIDKKRFHLIHLHHFHILQNWADWI